jgi:hypothetical protein
VDDAWEIHSALNQEALIAEQKARVSEIAHIEEQVRHLATATLTGQVVNTRREAEALVEAQTSSDDTEEPLPLTVRDIGVRLQSDITEGRVSSAIQKSVRQVAQRLLSLNDPLEPEHLTERGAETLMHRLGLSSIGNRLVGLFHEAALSLNLARQQDSIQLAAARRQKQARPRPLDRATNLAEISSEVPEEPTRETDSVHDASGKGDASDV